MSRAMGVSACGHRHSDGRVIQCDVQLDVGPGVFPIVCYPPADLRQEVQVLIERCTGKTDAREKGRTNTFLEPPFRYLSPLKSKMPPANKT